MNESVEHIAFLKESLPYLLQKIFITALLGLFIGLERESKKSKGEKSFAGIRTIPLISIFGFISALIGTSTSHFVFIAFFLVFGLLVSISYYFSAQKGEYGGTTEMTFLIMYVIGALVYWDLILFSAAITVILSIFLAYKSEFRTIAGNISDEDIFATIKFAILTLIILPLLPNENYGPFNSLNPQKIWLMVILIAGVSFVGYVLFKLIGSSRGIQLLSILGGIASSTALTISFTQRSKEIQSLSKNLAAGIIIASTIMFPRVLLIIFLLSSDLAEKLLIPFTLFTAAGIGASIFTWEKKQKENVKDIQLSNPFKVIAALKFGVIFAAVLLFSSAAKNYLGDQGIYYSSFLSGFADVDAVALTIADLITKSLSVEVASIAVILGCLSNSFIKAAIAAIFGSKNLRRFTLQGFIPMIVVVLIYSFIQFI